MTGYFESDLVKEIGLVFLLDSRGVAGAVHQSHENIKVVSKVNAAAVAELHWRTLASKKKRVPGRFSE